MDSYMYQTVGHDGIELYSEAMGLPLFRRTIQGNPVEQGKEYVQRQWERRSWGPVWTFEGCYGRYWCASVDIVMLVNSVQDLQYPSILTIRVLNFGYQMLKPWYHIWIPKRFMPKLFISTFFVKRGWTPQHDCKGEGVCNRIESIMLWNVWGTVFKINYESWL